MDSRIFSSIFRTNVKNIYINDQINVPSNPIGQWDISVNQDGGVIAYYVANATNSALYDLYIEGNGSIYTNYQSNNLFECFSNLESISGIEKLNTSLTTNTNHMFSFTKLAVPLDLRTFNMSKVTNASYMFSDFHGTELDLSNWNVSNVTDFRGMFSYANTITSLNISNWNTSNAIDLSYMFAGLRSLTSLDISSIRTPKVKEMEHMFSDLDNIKTLDLSKFDTSNVTNMNNMFQRSKMESLDLGTFTMDNVTTMMEMFSGCTNLTAINGTENWNLKKVKYFSSVFRDCTSLVSLGTSKWELDSVTAMDFSFFNTQALETLDISNWNTANVTNFTRAFSNTPKLKNMDISKLNLKSATNVSYMFYNSSSLGGTLNINALNLTNDYDMFSATSHQSGVQVTLNYTVNNEPLVDTLISEKTAQTNLVKGELIS